MCGLVSNLSCMIGITNLTSLLNESSFGVWLNEHTSTTNDQKTFFRFKGRALLIYSYHRLHSQARKGNGGRGGQRAQDVIQPPKLTANVLRLNNVGSTMDKLPCASKLSDLVVVLIVLTCG